MDVNFFLNQRTAFIGGFFDAAIAGFLETQRRIDQAEPPFDNPPYSEDTEPAYLAEWIDAGTGAEVVAQACVSLLSDTLKLYFNTLRKEIRFVFDKREKALAKKSFVRAYQAALGEILETDWSDCPVTHTDPMRIVSGALPAESGQGDRTFGDGHGINSRIILI